MGRPKLHDDQTERELLTAAEALLAEGGVEALSVRRLAEAARTTPRAIYSVFGGMDGLYRALFRAAFLALSADLDALPVTDDPRADLVTAGAVGFRGWAKAHPDLFRLAFQDRAQAVEPSDRAAGFEAFGRLRLRVARCIAAGVLPAGREAEVAVAFHALCEGMASLEARRGLLAHAGADAGVLWRQALEALVDGFRPSR